MSVPARYVVKRWWWRRFHPMTRIGWTVSTMGRSRPATQTIVGLGLIGAGFIAKRKSHRTILYRGTIDPGSGTHIKVYRGNESVYNGPIGG